VVGEPDDQRIEFFDALTKMEQQAITQRRDALVAKNREGALNDAEKAELRELLAARVPAPTISS
jgi:DNA primase